MRRKSLLAVPLGFALAALFVAACGWDPKKPFQRHSPEVDRAIAELDAAQNDAAAERLDHYLGASKCKDGAIAVPGVGDAENAGFDLGLAIFRIGEKFGRPFGERAPELDGGVDDTEKQLAAHRKDETDCARALLDQVLAQKLEPELEARARYLRGNLSFLDGKWDDAVADYDRALAVVPGVPGDAGDSIGRDAAWNRAVALRNKQEDEDKKKDAEPDAEPDANDGGDDASDGNDGGGGKDGGDDAGKDGGDDAGNDAGKDASPDAGDKNGAGGQDAGNDAGNPNDKDGGGNEPDGGQPPPTPAQNGASQDERMLDQFEQAPTWQKEEAKARMGGRRVRGMPDK